MIKVEFTGDSAAAILLDMKQFVGAAMGSLPGTVQTAEVIPLKPVKKSAEEKKPEAGSVITAPVSESVNTETALTEDAIKAERIVIRALVDERTKISKTVLEQVRTLLNSMPQKEMAKTVSTLDPSNFAAFKEKLLEIKVPEKK